MAQTTTSQKETWWVRYRATLRAHAYAGLLGLLGAIAFGLVMAYPMHLPYDTTAGLAAGSYLFFWGAIYTAIKDAPEMKRQW